MAATLLAGCGASGSSSGALLDSARGGDHLSASAPARLKPQSIDAAEYSAVVTTPIARLQKRLAKVLTAQGGQVGALVEDASSADVLFAEDPEVPRPPASVEKLYTSVAAVNVLGPNARFRTAVLGTGELDPAGIWHGNLYLRGGGDPTFGDGSWNKAYEDGYGPNAGQLATQLQKLGIRRVTGHIFADESLFDTDRGGPATGNLPDIPDYGGELSALVYDHGMTEGKMSPAVFAAHELALTLRGRGVRIGAGSRTRSTPADARLLAHVESPRLSVLLRLMDVPSDDLIADMLAKQLGAHRFGEGTLAAGATEISQTISSEYGLDPTIFDGSGLDRADRTTPLQVVTLLRRVYDTPTGALLSASLPTVGEQGTVQGIGVGTPAQGRCLAKTGTLNNVTNLAGYCSARGGQTLVFALMIDGPSNYQAVTELSRAVAAIANY
jgi:D-alanyl-D-alanine carboxypeptidase/D-alanyl-D-alanine-endopeptidase (penicillin-binding protein 4)